MLKVPSASMLGPGSSDVMGTLEKADVDAQAAAALLAGAQQRAAHLAAALSISQVCPPGMKVVLCERATVGMCLFSELSSSLFLPISGCGSCAGAVPRQQFPPSNG